MKKTILAAVLSVFATTATFAQTQDFTIELPETDVVALELAQPADEDGAPGRRGGDNFDSPQQREQAELRDKAIRARLAGKAAGKVHEVAKGQFVELGLERNDRVFVVLVEYGNGFSKIGANPTPNVPTTPGPLHN